MSDLLNQASLVMVPSGYKEDTVYSVVPSDGSGDMAFTRASNGTRVNSAGLVEVCPWNLVQYSEDLTNAIWAVEAGNSIIANTTTAPNGTLTADTISVASSFYMNTYEIVSTNEGVHTYSVYLKKNVTNLISLYIYQTFGASGFKALGEINFDNGTFTASVGTGTIESVGNGWFRLTLTATLLSGANSCGFYTSSTTGTRTVYVYGAQLNIGSTAKPYFPTTDRLNVPRLTYQNGGGGCPSLLLEKQSTNSFSYSEDFTNGFWTPIAIGITANQTTSPDGTQNAEKITEDATTSIHSFYNTNAVVVAATTTASIFYKKGTRRYFSIKLQIGTNSYTQVFDADAVTTGSSSSNGLTSVSTSIVSMGNGWVRASVTGTDPSAGTSNYMIFSLSNSANPTFDPTNFNPTYTGTGSDNGFIWGAQVEASSYSTSYIQTTSSSATRVADACFKTGISSLIGQTSGALFVEFNSSFLESYTQRIFTLSDGTTSNVIGFQLTGANELVFYVENGGTNQVVINKATPAITLGSNVKIAAAYANNDFVFYVNGTQIGTDTSGSVPATSQLRFSEANASAFYLGLIKQVCLFKTRLTNAELASLTTI